MDDDEHSRSMLIEVLRTSGYAVQGAEDGEAGLALLREATFDLLLTDLRLPGMDGLDLVRQAKSLHSPIPTIIVTGYGDKKSTLEALHLGVTDYLEKPILDLRTLVSAVERALK